MPKSILASKIEFSSPKLIFGVKNQIFRVPKQFLAPKIKFSRSELTFGILWAAGGAACPRWATRVRACAARVFVGEGGQLGVDQVTASDHVAVVADLRVTTVTCVH